MQTLRAQHQAQEDRSDVSFFDEYTEIRGNFIGADEKQVLIDEGIPFQITAIQFDEENKFGPRYVAGVLVPDPANGEEEERLISFPKGTVDSRDRMLAQMTDYLARDDAQPVLVKLEKAGKAILIRQA
jgi:hypothetical protein